MLAEHHCNRKRFSRSHRLLVVHFAVLARGDIKTHFVLIVQHHSVTANVFHAGLRIARDHEMGSSQVTTAVTFMPTRHRKLEQINLSAPLDIFHYGTSGNDCWSDRL